MTGIMDLIPDLQLFEQQLLQLQQRAHTLTGGEQAAHLQHVGMAPKLENVLQHVFPDTLSMLHAQPGPVQHARNVVCCSITTCLAWLHCS
jgi:hypothetical protein